MLMRSSILINIQASLTLVNVANETRRKPSRTKTVYRQRQVSFNRDCTQYLKTLSKVD